MEDGDIYALLKQVRADMNALSDKCARIESAFAKRFGAAACLSSRASKVFDGMGLNPNREEDCRAMARAGDGFLLRNHNCGTKTVSEIRDYCARMGA